MKSRLLISALFVLTAGVVLAAPYLGSARVAGYVPAVAPAVAIERPAPIAPPVEKAAVAALASTKPRVEVAFVLDTTGSMSGLIQGAKENIWAIATTMAQAKPAPEIRMGLVAFRDRGDEYITRVVDLSTDLDSMYATLMDFQAGGGGDGPESVNQALYDAVNRLSWSKDPSAYRVVFLVGDAPPHMDYQDDVKYPETLKLAAARGIVVNTIQAGDDGAAAREWQRIASLNQGQYLKVGQSGNAVAVVTPFDERIAALSKSLDETRLFYGDADTMAVMARKSAATDKLHAAGSVAAQAKRAMYNTSSAGKANFAGEHDLVDAVGSGRVDLAKVDAAQLPPALRSKSKEAQAQVVKETAEKRTELNRQILALSEQRRGYIASELKARGGAKDSLDYKIFDTVKRQAATKGLEYEAAPVH